MKTELYRKIKIKSEEDLPKENRKYFVHIKGVFEDKLYFLWDTTIKSYFKKKNVDWYLLPIELPTEEEVRLTNIKPVDKFPVPLQPTETSENKIILRDGGPKLEISLRDRLIDYEKFCGKFYSIEPIDKYINHLKPHGNNKTNY